MAKELPEISEQIVALCNNLWDAANLLEDIKKEGLCKHIKTNIEYYSLITALSVLYSLTDNEFLKQLKALENDEQV